jgi:hypothetical protein
VEVEVEFVGPEEVAVEPGEQGSWVRQLVRGCSWPNWCFRHRSYGSEIGCRNRFDMSFLRQLRGC